MQPPPPQVDINCFIFDLDGTLVFNEEANFRAYEAAFKATGHELDEADFKPHFQNGGTIEDIYTDYVTKHGLAHDPSMLGQIRTTKAKEYTDRFHLIEPNMAVIGLLRALAPHHHTALATSSRRVNA
jgi:beta-phosphoglucomutase-like phosphatase (HAD superfamily)